MEETTYDIFFHTYSLSALADNQHAQEIGVHIRGAPFEEALAFRSHLRRYSVTLQGGFDTSFVIPEHALHQMEYGFSTETVQNIFRELHSLREVTLLWEEEEEALRQVGPQLEPYALVFYLRPDVFYHDTLDASSLLQAAHLVSVFLSPAWQTFMGLNDRLAIGRASVMRVFGRRIDFLEAAAKVSRTPMFPEVFLKTVMTRLHNFTPINWHFRASRVRATGLVLCSDYWSSFDGVGNPHAPECSPWHPHTPPCHWEG
jgi:hypothetical protein